MTTLHLIYGPQGAGKSTRAAELARLHHALPLAIDDWMGQLYGPDLPQPMDLAWVMARVQRCESRIWHTAEAALRAGCAVVLDLGFMKRAQRAAAAARAGAADRPVQWHFVDAPLALRRERVARRNTQRGATFAFEVTPAMFDFMESQYEPPSAEERARAIVLESSS